MRLVEYSTQFRRDVKLAEKRGRPMSKLKTLVKLLVAGELLADRYRDHPLRNDWYGYRDAHIEPDWLLIYCLRGETLRLERTGSHADLFE